METDTPLTEISSYRWIILAVSWFVYFSFGIILTSIPPLASQIASDLSLTYTQTGIILGTMLLMYIPLSIPMGFIIDRVGQKRMISVGLLLISTSAGLRFFAFDFEFLFLTVLLFGFGGPTISVGLSKVVASSFIGRERAVASGIYMTGAFVGSATVLAITNTLIIPLVGTWRTAFVLYGLLGFLTAIIWLVLAREPRKTSIDESVVQPLRTIITPMLSQKRVWLIAIIFSSAFLAFYGVGNWLPIVLESQGMSSADAGLLASVPSWLGLIGSVILPGIRESGKRKSIVLALLFIEGISIFAIGITQGLQLIIVLALYGITNSAIGPLLIVILMDLPEVGAEYMGVASGTLFSIGALAGFIGPIFVGYLMELTGSFVLAFTLLALVVEMMLAITLVLKED